MEPIKQPTLQLSVEPRSAEILNRTFSSLPPENLLFEDSTNSRYLYAKKKNEKKKTTSGITPLINIMIDIIRETMTVTTKKVSYIKIYRIELSLTYV